jgi:hypothetical protein
MMHMRGQQTPGLNTLLQQLQLRRETDTMSKYNLDSSYSQAKARAGMEDPFGTLRGSKTRRSLRERTPNMPDSFKPKVRFSYDRYFLKITPSFSGAALC